MITACLGDVAEFINGFAFKPEDWHEDGLPIVRIQNLTDESKPINRSKRSVPDKFRVRRGELLVSWSATLGVFVWDRTDEALVNQHIFRVVPRPHVHKDFLRHMLAGALESMSRHLHGATMKHVNRSEFLSTEIPLPSISEQRRIAAILDQADALGTKRRKILAHLDALARALFYESFGSQQGTMRILGEVSTFVGGGSLPGGLPFVDQTHGTLLMKVSDMNAPGNEVEIKTTASWTCAVTGRSATVGAGAIVIPKRGASIATNKKRITTRRTALDPNLMGIQPNGDVITSRYLYEWFRAFNLSTITSGSTVPQLNKQDLVPLLINVPIIPQQIEFGQRQSKLDAIRAVVRRELAVDAELYASLQFRAFRGEL